MINKNVVHDDENVVHDDENVVCVENIKRLLKTFSFLHDFKSCEKHHNRSLSLKFFISTIFC